MNDCSVSLPHVTCISQHGFAALFENNETGEKSLYSTTAYNAGDVLATFEASQTFSAPNKYTVQTGDNTHIIMKPEVLQFLNHSCNPNIFLDTSLFQIKALKYIGEGDELRFFYPSTEWIMQSPFTCRCGSHGCLHEIKGAFFLSPPIIARYQFTDFILQKLNNFKL